MRTVKPRAFALEELLRPLVINYDVRPLTRREHINKRRGQVLLVYPFLDDDERRRADHWLARCDEKLENL